MCVCQEGQASQNLPACLSIYGMYAFGEDYWATQRNAIIAVMYTRWLSVLLRVGLFLRQDSSVLNAANKRWCDEKWDEQEGSVGNKFGKGYSIRG